MAQSGAKPKGPRETHNKTSLIKNAVRLFKMAIQMSKHGSINIFFVDGDPNGSRGPA